MTKDITEDDKQKTIKKYFLMSNMQLSPPHPMKAHAIPVSKCQITKNEKDCFPGNVEKELVPTEDKN